MHDELGAEGPPPPRRGCLWVCHVHWTARFRKQKSPFPGVGHKLSPWAPVEATPTEMFPVSRRQGQARGSPGEGEQGGRGQRAAPSGHIKLGQTTDGPQDGICGADPNKRGAQGTS